jgi:hypothetical protein
MLDDFFEHARINQNQKWLHWNMRDANYGFPALEQRHRALGGTPFHIDERNLFDLSRILIGIFGVGYIGHPRLQNLMTLNNMTAMDFLSGEEEAIAFVNKQFVRLHQSTLRKVDVLANIAERAHNGSLKVLSSWWERNGRTFKAAIEVAKEHWVLSGISVVALLAGVAQKIFGFFG